MGIRNIAPLVALIAVFAVVALCAVPAAHAAKKSPGSSTVACTCTCTSDKKGQGGLPVLWESVTFQETPFSCYALSGNGRCSIKAGGKTLPGTYRNCDYTPNNPASHSNAGADQGGGAPPTSPFSRPGIILLPHP